MPTPTSTNLWHGYTMNDLDRLARTAAARARGSRMIDPSESYHAAWSAITELLGTAPKPPTWTDVLAAGMDAVGREAEEHRQLYGMGRASGSGVGSRPRFQSYWDMGRVTPSPEDGVIDRLALHQIWPKLSRTYQQAIYAHAIHGGDDYAAAASLGYTLGTYQSYLKRARAAYRLLWHEHETPSHLWGRTGHGQRTAMQTLQTRQAQRARRRRAAQQAAA
jgi:hypothetical protein